MDSIREVFNTMVAVATVIGPGHAIKFAPFREAVKQLLAIYPLLSGRSGRCNFICSIRVESVFLDM
eukprot:1138807-Pelagomonas_calceolata.AAC.5